MYANQPVAGHEEVEGALQWYLNTEGGPRFAVVPKHDSFISTYTIHRMPERLYGRPKEVAKITMLHIPDQTRSISVNSKDVVHASPMMLEMLVDDALTGLYPRAWKYEPPAVRF